ncbi:MAG: hypothetical protein PHW76_03440 [Alphaproteobacteria bacterium]|nr:hypothetical protein [Alphaproteobacteria bacterium]
MLTNKNFTFEDMAARFGEIVAYSCLQEIERAAGLVPTLMIGIEPELRLVSACRIQDAKRKTPVKEMQPDNNTMLEAA